MVDDDRECFVLLCLDRAILEPVFHSLAATHGVSSVWKWFGGRPMTEAEWLACDDPDAMFDLLPADASDRKLRLFGVACCHHVEEHLWAGSGSQFAIKIAEVYADHLTTEEELQTAQQAVESRLELYPGEPVYDASFWACGRPMNEAAWRCAFYAANCSTRPIVGKGLECEAKAVAARTRTTRAQAALLRDIFGNPFHSVTPNPTWLTSNVLALAQQMYNSRDFSPMPILADALQGADLRLPP
jgi:hypothetical protein